MLLTAQVALAVQNNQNNPFLSAYTNMLASSGILPSIMAERLKSARYSPYPTKEKSAISPPSPPAESTTATATIKASVISRLQTTVRLYDFRGQRPVSLLLYFTGGGGEPQYGGGGGGSQ